MGIGDGNYINNKEIQKYKFNMDACVHDLHGNDNNK